VLDGILWILRTGAPYAPGFDRRHYWKRNRVERLIGRLKQHRRVHEVQRPVKAAVLVRLGLELTQHAREDARWCSPVSTGQAG
jgi:hypothetical protein